MLRRPPTVPVVGAGAADTQIGRADVSDAELVQLAAGGDLSAFERIMRRYNQRLFRVAFGIIGEASESEDILQESYVRAYYALGQYAGRGSLGAWLAQVVRNEAIDRLRARNANRKHVALESEMDETDGSFSSAQSSPSDVHADPEAAITNAEMKSLLEQAIATLPETFRAVFMLREVEGMSIEETAEYLAIPPATVRTRDFRARSLLRKRIGERIDRTLPGTFEFLSTRCDAVVASVLGRLRN